MFDGPATLVRGVIPAAMAPSRRAAAGCSVGSRRKGGQARTLSSSGFGTVGVELGGSLADDFFGGVRVEDVGESDVDADDGVVGARGEALAAMELGDGQFGRPWEAGGGRGRQQLILQHGHQLSRPADGVRRVWFRGAGVACCAIDVESGPEDAPAADDDLVVSGIADHGSADGRGIDGLHEGLRPAEVAGVLVDVEQHGKFACELVALRLTARGKVAEDSRSGLGVGCSAALQNTGWGHVADGRGEPPCGLVTEGGGVQAGVEDPGGAGAAALDLDEDRDGGSVWLCSRRCGSSRPGAILQ